MAGTPVLFQPETGDVVSVSREVIALMKSIGQMLKDLNLEDSAPETPITLKEVKGEIFAKVRQQYFSISFSLPQVITFCELYLANPALEKTDKKKLELLEWERKYCEDLDQVTLFWVIRTANFLDIKPLLDLTLLFLAMKLITMTPEEISREYNVDITKFTVEDQEKAKREYEEIIMTTLTKRPRS